MKHNVSVYRRTGSDGEVARGDCDCGWTTGLQYDGFAWVKREAANHERRTTRKVDMAR